MYLDNAATTKPKQEVIDTMLAYLTEYWENPSAFSLNSPKIKKDIEIARDTVAKSINAKDGNNIFFTSGGSESNCWAIQGFINNRLNNMRIPYIITTKIEHKSIMSCLKNQTLATVYYLDVDKDGFISLAELDDTISLMLSCGVEPKDILVSIQFANNEVGTIQDVININNVCHMYGCVFHTDAVQAFGHVYIDVDAMGIDMLSASAHKIGGCKGTGFLYIKDGIEINPLIYGSQMDGMRGGTENVAGIMGMAEAVELIDLNDANDAKFTRDYFIDKLADIGCKLNGPDGNAVFRYRLPNNINVILPDNISGEDFVLAISTDGIDIGTGSACNSHFVEPSYVLKAMGLTDDEANCSIRISIPDNMTMDDVDNIMNSIKQTIDVILSIPENENN